MLISELLSNRVYDGHRAINVEESVLFTDSLCNDYIPFYCIFFGQYKKVGDVRYLHYFLPSITQLYVTNPSNRIADFKNFMNNRLVPLPYIKTNRVYHIAKQYIAELEGDTRTLLYLLVIKKEYLYDINFSNLDYSKFAILISDKFDTPERKLMFGMVKREIINPLYELGIDVIYTNNIEKWCFKQPHINLSFDTVSEMKNFFKETTKEVINEVTGITPTRR